jgi:hypothetical protein
VCGERTPVISPVVIVLLLRKPSSPLSDTIKVDLYKRVDNIRKQIRSVASCSRKHGCSWIGLNGLISPVISRHLGNMLAEVPSQPQIDCALLSIALGARAKFSAIRQRSPDRS